MTDVTIKQVDRDSVYLDRVRELADKNSSTLGFLPYTAYEDHAVRKTILAAISPNGDLAGYLLYRIVKRENLAKIVHLCIDPKYRGQGIPQKLFDALCERTQALRGIGLWCKQDQDYYAANRVWRKLGFTARREKPGRGQQPSVLVFWWFNHGHQTLFDFAAKEKLKVVIDANIFFDLQNPASGSKESLALQADWLQEEIVLVVTPELFHEIGRNSNSHVRDKHRNSANGFLQTQAQQIQFEAICSDLEMIFPEDLKQSDESDLKQVAWAIADSEVKFFITRDENLLKIGTQIYDEFGLPILHPADLVLKVDELFRIEDYRDMRLAGTTINQRRIQTGEHDELAYLFRNEETEKRAQFLEYFRRHLLEPEKHFCYVVEDSESTPIILFVHDRSSNDELSIPLFRYNRTIADKNLIRYLILRFLALAARENRNVIRFADPFPQNVTIECLQEDAFTQVNSEWLKISLLQADEAHMLASALDNVLSGKPQLRPYYQLHVSLLQGEVSAANTQAMIEIERLFWPVKVIDAEIPTITVPIKTEWASLWFDEDLARQTLLGAQKDRAFNREGVYYSSAKRPNISLPGRILWYVTKDDRVYGAQSVRACSRLEDIVVGKPKDLFRQFRHLGIYEWTEVYRLAKKDIEKEIMALHFSDTLLFSRPVPYTEWQKITQDERGTNPPILSPSVMPSNIFKRVYRRGMDLD